MKELNIKIGQILLLTKEVFFTVNGLSFKLFLGFNSITAKDYEGLNKELDSIKEMVKNLREHILKLNDDSDPDIINVDGGYIRYKLAWTTIERQYYDVPFNKLSSFIQGEVNSLLKELKLLISGVLENNKDNKGVQDVNK